MSYATARRHGANSDINKLYPEDRSVHEWYRFVLSFPPHLVRDYLRRFGIEPGQRVLDPFCGTGTTLVECKKHGVPSVGVEANPQVMALFAFEQGADGVAIATEKHYRLVSPRDLTPDELQSYRHILP